MIPRPLNDEEIRYLLVEIDESDEIRVTTLETEFLEEILFKHSVEWSVEQRAKAAQIAAKYRHQL